MVGTECKIFDASTSRKNESTRERGSVFMDARITAPSGAELHVTTLPSVP
jgi:hypothetical protein